MFPAAHAFVAVVSTAVVDAAPGILVPIVTWVGAAARAGPPHVSQTPNHRAARNRLT